MQIGRRALAETEARVLVHSLLPHNGVTIDYRNVERVEA